MKSWENENANNGAARGIRTPDPLITNEVLYQLSYCGVIERRRGVAQARSRFGL